MLQYKQNLEVLNGRYTDVERQILKIYARILGEVEREMPDGGSLLTLMRDSVGAAGTFGFGDIAIHRDMVWLVSNLLDDGIVEVHKQPTERGAEPTPRPNGAVLLTRKGIDLIKRMIAAEPL